MSQGINSLGVGWESVGQLVDGLQAGCPNVLHALLQQGLGVGKPGGVALAVG